MNIPRTTTISLPPEWMEYLREAAAAIDSNNSYVVLLALKQYKEKVDASTHTNSDNK